MWWYKHLIQLKYTRPYPLMNSFLGTCSQLHQLRICMKLFIQKPLIHSVSADVTIVRSKVNQNINNLIKNPTFHLDNRCLMISLPIIQCCINWRNTLPNIPNYLCLLSTINLRLTTLIIWKISPAMILATNPTLQRLTIITLVLLLRLKSLSFVNCIEFLIWCCIFLVICIMIFSSLLIPLSVILLITFPILRWLRLTLWFLITMLKFFYAFL